MQVSFNLSPSPLFLPTLLPKFSYNIVNKLHLLWTRFWAIIERLCIVLSTYIKFWLTPIYYQRVVWFELCELFRVLKSNFIEFARKTSIKLIVRPYLFLTIIKMPTFWFQRFNLIIFLYWQDEISSELALVKGKVDSILSDSEVTVQVRKFPHHYVV